MTVLPVRAMLNSTQVRSGRRLIMPDKKNRRFTKKEDRQAEHIKESEMERGKSKQKAERIGYATLNKQKSEKKKD